MTRADQLIAFELNKASDFGKITRHYTSGSFGRGTDDPLNYRASVLADGDVKLQLGSLQRGFLRNTNADEESCHPSDSVTSKIFT